MRSLGFIVSAASFRRRPRATVGRPYCGKPVAMLQLPEEEAFEAAAENIVQLIQLFGGGTLVLAAVLGTINFIFSTINSSAGRSVFNQFMPLDFDIGAGPATLTKVRLQLAQMIALGLGVLLVSDVLETLVKSSTAYEFDSLYKLAIVAAIRTGLSYFLGLETEEIYEQSKAEARLDGRDLAYQESIQNQSLPDNFEQEEG